MKTKKTIEKTPLEQAIDSKQRSIVRGRDQIKEIRRINAEAIDALRASEAKDIAKITHRVERDTAILGALKHGSITV